MSAADAAPRRVVVWAHASVLDRGGYARRVLDAAATWRDAFPGATVTVATVESPRALRDPTARAEVQHGLSAHGVDLVVVHGWPRRWGLARLADGFAARAAARLFARTGADLVHAHGPRAARSALAGARRVPSVRVVVDVHGDRAAETRLERGEPDGASTAPDPAERAVVASAAGVFHASEALAARFPAGPGRPSAVVPCLVDDARIPADDAAEAARTAARRAWGLAGDEWVVAYAGSLASWQEVPRLAAIVRHAADRVPQLRCLVVTPAKAEAAALFARAGLPRGKVMVVSPPSEEVVRTLAGADAAALLRRPALANHLAFPTKLAEYLAAGLDVVASDACPAVAGAVTAAPGLGQVVPWAADDATFAARLAGAARPGTAAERASRRAYARAALARSAAVPAYRRVGAAAVRG